MPSNPTPEAFRAFLERHDLTPDDLDVALTHKSFEFEAGAAQNNETLEFLGDAVLGLAVSEILYRRGECTSEGELSAQRSHLVSRKVLGKVAKELGVGELIKLGRGEELSGGRARISTLGCCLEAIVGAIYLKSGYAPCLEFAQEFVVQGVHLETAQEGSWDAKSALQQFSQQHDMGLPEYVTVASDGPDHERSFTVEVSLEGKVLGRGTGRRKKQAENAAAALALRALEEQDEE
jgi:ribonuclease-3